MTGTTAQATSPARVRALALFGLRPGASLVEIKSAWRAAVLSAHPDRGGDPAEFRRVHAAYELLMSPDAGPAVRAGQVDSRDFGTWEDIVADRAAASQPRWRRSVANARKFDLRKFDRAALVLFTREVREGARFLWGVSPRSVVRISLLTSLSVVLIGWSLASLVVGRLGVGSTSVVLTTMVTLLLLLAAELAGWASASGPGLARSAELTLPLLALIAMFTGVFVALFQIVGMVALALIALRALSD